MAEGLLRRLAGGRAAVFSAGTKPSTVNPHAVAVMAERGIDLAGQRSKHLSEFLSQPFDYVITVCDQAAEACPVFPGPARRIHWSIPDPAAVSGAAEQQLDAFRAARDDLELRLRGWLDELSHPVA